MYANGANCAQKPPIVPRLYRGDWQERLGPAAEITKRRFSTALHTLAPEIPMAKTKAHGQTGFGEART
jgi:hypothetical protein